jgi:hypothetical protein
VTEELVETLPEQQPASAPVDAQAALARKNLLWGWALFGLFLLLFAGTVAVALVYLALD